MGNKFFAFLFPAMAMIALGFVWGGGVIELGCRSGISG